MICRSCSERYAIQPRSWLVRALRWVYRVRWMDRNSDDPGECGCYWDGD